MVIGYCNPVERKSHKFDLYEKNIWIFREIVKAIARKTIAGNGYRSFVRIRVVIGDQGIGPFPS
jgi:hypothetical protein